MFKYNGAAVLTCPHNHEMQLNVQLREYREAWGVGSWSGTASTNKGTSLHHAMDCNNRLVIKLPDGRQGDIMITNCNVNGNNYGTAVLEGRGEPPTAAAA